MTVAIATRLPQTAASTPQKTLAAEADHRIGNNLALIAAMLRLQASDIARGEHSLSSTEVRGILAETASRIEAVGRLHRRLADASDTAIVDVGDYLQEIATAIVKSVAAPEAASLNFDLAPSCALHASQVLLSA